MEETRADIRQLRTSFSKFALYLEQFKEERHKFEKELIERTVSLETMILKMESNIRDRVASNKEFMQKNLAELNTMNIVQLSDIKHLKQQIRKMEDVESAVQGRQAECRADVIGKINDLDHRISQFENSRSYTAKLWGWGVLLLGTVSYFIHLVIEYLWG